MPQVLYHPFHTDPLIRIRDPDRIQVQPRCAFTRQYSCVMSVHGKSSCRENGVQRSTSFVHPFWLRWRRLRLARARIRRVAAAQSIELAVEVAQWRLTSHVAISAALHLLQGNWLKRQVWVKPRSASLYQDIVLGWNNNYFKANFRISRTNFAYLVNELQPVLQRHQHLHSTIPLNNCIQPHVQKGHPFFVGPLNNCIQPHVQKGHPFFVGPCQSACCHF